MNDGCFSASNNPELGFTIILIVQMGKLMHLRYSDKLQVMQLLHRKARIETMFCKMPEPARKPTTHTTSHSDRPAQGTALQSFPNGNKLFLLLL